MSNDNLDLPNLVRVWEAVGVGRIPRPEATKEFYDAFNPDLVLALLRRLWEAEELASNAVALVSEQQFAELKADRDRLAERVKIIEADNAALLKQLEEIISIEPSSHTILALTAFEQCIKGRCREVLEQPHPGIALTQRLAMMEEGFNELVKSYHAMQQTAMKLFDRLDANGLIGADGTERNALLQEISPVDAITSEDIAKAQQALEGK